MKKISKISKQTKTVLIQIIMGMILGFILGGILLSAFDLERFGLDIMFYYLVMIVISYILNIVIHEGGHCLFGYFNGFDFRSFRIGSYMWVKENTKIRFTRYKLAGTGGQCLMDPPEPDLKAYCLYSIGGGVLNLISALLFWGLGMSTQDTLFHIFCFCMVGFGLLCGIMNLIPIDAQVPNDGYNVYCMIKERKSVQSMYQQLMLSKEFSEGKRLDEIDEKYFLLYEGADLCNPLNTCIEANRGSRLMALHQYEEAEKCLKNLYEKPITQVYKNSVIYDLILIELLTRDHPDTEQYLDEKMKKNMNRNKSDVSSLLDQYGIDLLVVKDEEQAKIDLKYFKDACKTYPYQGVLESIKEFQKLLEERKNQDD